MVDGRYRVATLPTGRLPLCVLVFAAVYSLVAGLSYLVRQCIALVPVPFEVDDHPSVVVGQATKRLNQSSIGCGFSGR
ncbi:hypothetical protein QFZ76_000422 [Streptomyces sp. V4I2]|nr:hypothetical protein [Streptomyces sp. V4I2]